jgi:hypothetical protein
MMNIKASEPARNAVAVFMAIPPQWRTANRFTESSPLSCLLPPPTSAAEVDRRLDYCTAKAGAE